MLAHESSGKMDEKTKDTEYVWKVSVSEGSVDSVPNDHRYLLFIFFSYEANVYIHYSVPHYILKLPLT
jgi:hypothetical protein